MKKIKFLVLGILSILLISPVFAENYNLSNFPGSQIDFESESSESHVSYLVGNDFNYITDNISLNNGFYYFQSQATDLTGYVFDSTTSGFYNFNILGSNTYFRNLGGGGVMMSISRNSSNRIKPDNINIYYQRPTSNLSSYSGMNYVFRIGSLSNYANIINERSYIRIFYNTQNPWFLNSPIPNGFVSGGDSVQYFTHNSNTFKTDKGTATLGVYLSNISPSVGNGFSFLKYLSKNNDNILYEDIKFYSVFPNWDSSRGNSSTYNIPSSNYSSDMYIFRLDSFKYNSSFNKIGVLSKCTPSLCGGISDLETYLSSLIYSEYICDFSSSYNLKNNCILVGGGVLDHVLGTITGLNNPLNFYSVSTFGKILLYGDQAFSTSSVFNNSKLNLNFSSDSTHLSILNSYFSTSQGVTYGRLGSGQSYNLSFIGGYTLTTPPNILGVSDTIPDVPDSGGGSQGGSTPQTPEEITDELTTQRGIWSVLCKLNIFNSIPNCSAIHGSGYEESITILDDGKVWVNITIPGDTQHPTPESCYGEFTGSDGTPYIYSWDYTENVCKFYVYTDSLAESFDSTPDTGTLYGLGIDNIESLIQSAFSGEFQNFKFYSCPFNAPLGVIRFSSIRGMSAWLLDKFYDINLVGPFNCLMGGVLYSITKSNDLTSDLFTYDGPKYFTNFPIKVKRIIDIQLVALILLLFWKFRPSNHD